MSNLLNNRYRILRALGSGGFGDTFLAEDTHLPSNRRCVVKQLKPITNNPNAYRIIKERFQREAANLEILSKTTNQIPALYAYFSESNELYLVQEWIEGKSLKDKLEEVEALSESTVKDILVDILPVLDYIHSQGIIHRDIKPDNIMLRDRDGKPVLIDFGAIKEIATSLIDSHGNPITTIIIGTPGFMSSEQAKGKPVFASDVYSLGITAICLLSGKYPQQLMTDPGTDGIIWHQYASYLSPGFVAVLDRAIEPLASNRYQSATEMLGALKAIEPAIVSTVPTAPEHHQVELPRVTAYISPTIKPFLTAFRSIVSANSKQWLVFGGSAVVLIGALLLATNISSWRQRLAHGITSDKTNQTSNISSLAQDKAEKDNILLALSNYKIGIYFPGKDLDLTKEANNVRSKLIQYGVTGEIQLYGKDDLFFERAVPPNGFEIRYEPGHEDDVADALENILKEIYQSKTFRKQSVTSDRTANFISLFLGANSQNSNFRDLNIKNWSGMWEQTFHSKLGTLNGNMNLQADQSGEVTGSYDYPTDKSTIKGTLKGSLSDNALSITGSWNNNIGQGGRFFLKLGTDSKSFDGKYSMSADEPNITSENSWRGTKLSNLEPENIDDLVKKFDGDERLVASNHIIVLYKNNKTEIVRTMIDNILPDSDPKSYRRNLYIAFTLARIKPFWEGSRDQLETLSTLKRSNSYSNKTFRRRVDEAISNHKLV